MPFVVEKLSASVSGVHRRVCARSAQPVQRSSTVSPRRRTTSAPPPRPRVTSFANASTARRKPGSAWPRTAGGSGSLWVSGCAAKPGSLRRSVVEDGRPVADELHQRRRALQLRVLDERALVERALAEADGAH